MPPKKKPVSALNAWLDKLKDPSKFATSNDLSPPDLEEAYGLRPGRNCAPSKFTTIADETESDFSDSVFTPKKKGKAKEKQTTLSFGQKPTTQCSHEKCADNPKCLTHMGQKQWENSAKAFKLYAKAVGLPDDPSERERDHSKPVGLRVRFPRLPFHVNAHHIRTEPWCDMLRQLFPPSLVPTLAVPSRRLQMPRPFFHQTRRITSSSTTNDFCCFTKRSHERL